MATILAIQNGFHVVKMYCHKSPDLLISDLGLIGPHSRHTEDKFFPNSHFRILLCEDVHGSNIELLLQLPTPFNAKLLWYQLRREVNVVSCEALPEVMTVQ